MAHDTPETGLDGAQEIYSVSSLVRETRNLLETEFGSIWVEGEISNLARPASGHLYFTLKDEKAQVRCALFRGQRTRLKVEPENGMLVKVRARVSLYEPRGDFQLIVNSVEPAGIGALQRAFEALRLKLLNEGLFESEHKQALPTLPKRIGVITSPSGAVIHDILTTLKRRFPAIQVLLLPVAVQGNEAAPQIVEAIRLAEEYAGCDALILARGGGSLEDLWAFNEETVARAIFDCPIPLISSIGHETDFTIADFVADARAPTPTAAAEMLSPNGADWLARLEKIELNMARTVRDKITQCAQSVDLTSKRLVHPGQRINNAMHQLSLLGNRMDLTVTNHLRFANAQLNPLARRLLNIRPDKRIRDLDSTFQSLATRLLSATSHAVRDKHNRLKGLVKRLNTLNPLETLGRGFAIFYKDDADTVVSSIQSVSTGEHGRIRLADGELRCLIEDINEKD